MKKVFFILLLVLALHSYSGWSQSNLLNAKVPQEIGIQEEEYQNPIAYGYVCLLYTSPSPRDRTRSRMPSSA